MHLVNELDILLASYKKPKERIKIVSDTIIQSLILQDPFKFIKGTISVHRAKIGLLKACGSIALSENIPMEQAEAD